MVSMLVPLLVASAPAPASTDLSVTDIAAVNQGVEVWLDTRAAYERGERARVHARAGQDGYLLVLHADAAGRVRILFPIDPYVDDFVRGGETLEIRGRGDRDAFLVDERSGAGLVLAAWSPDPFRFDGYVRGDHWDYRAISPIRGVDAEAELLDLAQRMAAGPFDYDVAEYIVGAVEPYRTRPVRITTSWYDPWCVACVGWRPAARSGFYLSVGFGSFGTHAAIGFGSYYPVYRPIVYHRIRHRPIWYYPAYYGPYYARPHRIHPVWGYYHPGRRSYWRHRHYHWPYHHGQYYRDGSSVGIRVRHAGSFDWGDVVFRSASYSRARPGVLTRASDRPFDGSGRRVQVRRAVPRSDPEPRAGVRRTAIRNSVGRPVDESTRTPPRSTRARAAQERTGNERNAITPRTATRRAPAARSSNAGSTRAETPRPVPENARSARARGESSRQATPRARSEPPPRAQPRATARSPSAPAAQPRSTATRSRPTPSSSSRVRRATPPRRSEARPTRPAQTRPAARPSRSSPSRESARPSRSSQRPAAASRPSRSRPSAARSSRGGGSGKARSTGSSRGRGKKKR